MKNIMKFGTLLTAASFGVALASPAFAQEASPDQKRGVDRTQPEDANDIVVTALRRDLRLQDVPLAISAVGGEQLASQNIVSTADLTRSVPSLTINTQGPGTNRIVIRGIQSAGEPTVSLYFDETPMPGAVGNTSDAAARSPGLRLFDVARVEVLRGPQGTLYGSGSMGGTVRIINNKPSDHFEAGAEGALYSVDGGNLGYRANGMVNLPIADGLAIRVVGYYADGGGYIDNVALRRNNINDYRSAGGRILLQAKPTPELTLDASASVQRDKGEAGQFNPALGRWIANDGSVQMFRDNIDIYNFTANWKSDAVAVTGVVSRVDRRYFQSLDLTYGNLTFLNNANTCRVYNGGAACDATATASYNAFVRSLTPAVSLQPNSIRDTTAELRISSNGSSPFTWAIGGFYEKRNINVIKQDVTAGADGRPLEPYVTQANRVIADRLEQKAAFGEIGYKLWSKLAFTAGIRYFDYDRQVAANNTKVSLISGGAVTPPIVRNSRQDGTVLRFNLSYEATNDLMFYANAAQGFRPGGTNQAVGLPASFEAYSSDSLWNYEAGVKSSWLDNALTVNLAGFLIDWKNIQISATGGGACNCQFRFITNAGAARVKGLEFDTSLTPVKGFTLQGNFSVLDAKLTEDQTTATITAPGRSGDRIPYIPHFIANASAQYRVPVSSNADLMIRADMNHMGSSYTDFRLTNPLTRKQEAYTIFGARIGVEAQDGKWGAYVYIDNAFNKLASTFLLQNAFLGIENGVPRQVQTSLPPRVIGVSFRGSF